MSKLIFGCGYVGLRVAEAWLAEGAAVHVVTRSPARAKMLRERGLQPLVADITRPASLGDLPPATTVLFAVGFDRSAAASIQEVYVDGLSSVLAALPPDVQRLIYLSSTGVYAQAHDEWVDEETPAQPLREGGRACLDAEACLRSHTLGERSVILRLAGIYGPDRVPRKADLASGRSLRGAATGFLNLIHVDDVVRTILASESPRLTTPRTYVVSDGHPVLRMDYYRELCRLAGCPLPPIEPPAAGTAVAERARGSKRIRSDRVRRDLALRFAFPSYREGLAAILAAEGRTMAGPRETTGSGPAADGG